MRGNVQRILWFAAMMLVASCSHTPTDPNEANWRVLAGHVERFSDPGFRAGRTCWVYLPPNYSLSQDRYPVLYATDGELVFDGAGEMRVNRICEDLIRGGEIRPIIVVAIENVGNERFWDLAPWYDNVYYHQGGGGEAFLRAIRDTLKPAIDRRFRTSPDAANTAITGVSLGGLFAAYAGLESNDTFGNVAAFSPSYWLRGYRIQDIADSIGYALPGRIRTYYQDSGTIHDNDIEGMEHVLEAHGFTQGLNLMSFRVQDAQHNYHAWAHRYPDMLRFLFGRR